MNLVELEVLHTGTELIGLAWDRGWRSHANRWVHVAQAAAQGASFSTVVVLTTSPCESRTTS